jgi:RNA recognition motif-containing protein
MRDKFNNRSKGFGFVDMPNDTEAQAAMSSLNGASVMGRNITVNEARPKTDRPANKGFRKKSW